MQMFVLCLLSMGFANVIAAFLGFLVQKVFETNFNFRYPTSKKSEKVKALVCMTYVPTFKIDITNMPCFF